MTDPAECGPVTLAFCQDTQTEAFDWPESFFAPRVWPQRRIRPDAGELAAAAEVLRGAQRPLLIAGGGVHYSDATDALRRFAETHQMPVAETQAGKPALPWDHPLNLGAIGVTGTGAANLVAAEADLILAVGTRMQDFTTGSWALFRNPARRFVMLNAAAYDAAKHGALPLVCDARAGLEELSAALAGWSATAPDPALKAAWLAEAAAATAAPEGNALPTDAQVIGAVQRTAVPDTVLVSAAGGLPGELHKLWQAARPGDYHLEYGYSTMGYEIAGGLGVKMALPEREVVVMVGDGSYMMLNSELATSVMLGRKIIVVILDNRGFGCIDRLQRATGGKSFNNLLDTARHEVPSTIDFATHAAAMGVLSEKVGSIAELEQAMARAQAADRSYAIVIETDPAAATGTGGHWWDVAVPEVSERPQVAAARRAYDAACKAQRAGD